MGQKVHPIGFRLGVSRDWASKWYAEGKDYADFIEKDFVIRNLRIRYLQVRYLLLRSLV